MRLDEILSKQVWYNIYLIVEKTNYVASDDGYPEMLIEKKRLLCNIKY